MSLKASLDKRPVIYEIVPPRRDTSRYHSELRGVEAVLQDPRITAVNVPELMRRIDGKRVHYSPVTIPPEEYALLIKEYKESVVNIIAPRLAREEFLRRARRVLHEYGIPNLVLVGKEKHGDVLPGPGVLEGLELLAQERGDHVALGGICIFNRRSAIAGDYGGGDVPLTEARRVWSKSRAGCDFVTSQISFDPEPALDFLTSYERLCEATGVKPVTTFISLATIPTPSILSLVESLDVVIPPRVKRKLVHAEHMGKASVEISTEVLQRITSEVERRHVGVPLGLQVEQVGVNSGDLALELLDSVAPLFS